MLQELLYEFQNHSNGEKVFTTDEMVLDGYILKPGVYVRVRPDICIDFLQIDKKQVVDIVNQELHEWFMKHDYLSSLVAMNKPMDPKKKVHSNNIYTMFCKIETFLDKKEIHPNLTEDIERYFNSFLVVKETKILEAKGYLPLNSELIQLQKVKILKVLTAVADYLKTNEIKDNSYVKIFLDEVDSDYDYESNRYMLTKIFNSNSYNILVGDKLLGLSNANMGLNSKKIYLEHKTTAFEVPYRISLEEGMQLRKLFVWLSNQTRTVGYIPVMNHSSELLMDAKNMKQRQATNFIHFEKGIDVTIDDYDMLPSYSDTLDEKIDFYNYLNIDEYNGGAKSRLYEIEAMVNEYLYGGQLSNNYYIDKIKVSGRLSKNLADQIMQSRDMFHAWFKKGNELPIKGHIHKITLQAVLALLQNTTSIKSIGRALNVRMALCQYFNKEGESNMGKEIERAYGELREKVLGKNAEVFCNGEIEFYLASGQLLKYLFGLSKAQKMHYDVLFRGIGTSKNAEDVKEYLIQYIAKYGHAVDVGDKKFEKLLSIVTSYQGEETAMIDVILCGFATNNII